MEPLDFYKQIQPFVIQDAKDAAQGILKEDQYTVATTQGHSHNGVDSMSVDYTSLVNKFFYVPITLFGTQAATAGNYGIFFIAPDQMLVLSAQEVHQTLGTDGSAVSVQIVKLSGTTAVASGTNLLQTAFDLKGTINSVQNGAIVLSSTPTTQNLTNYLAKGDRLALKLTGTPTSVANVTVVVRLLLIP